MHLTWEKDKTSPEVTVPDALLTRVLLSGTQHGAQTSCVLSQHHCRLVSTRPCISPGAARRRDKSTQPSLFQPRHVTARLRGQTEPRRAPRPSPRDVWKVA